MTKLTGIQSLNRRTWRLLGLLFLLGLNLCLWPERYAIQAHSIQPYTSVPLACPAITFTFNMLPTHLIGMPVNTTFAAKNGQAPYTYAVTVGNLPPGVSLAGSGLLSGTASQSGDFFFTVTAMDSNGCKGSQGYKLTVNGCPPLSIQPGLLPSGWVGTSYSATLTAAGHVSPYTFSVSSGTLPPGLSLAPNGSLSGTPTSPGQFNFTVQATSSNSGCTGTRGYRIQFSAHRPPQTLPPGASM